MDIWSKIVAVNIGKAERYARGLLGLSLMVLALALPTRWGWLGAYPLLTGLFGTSPFYKLVGINTGPKAKARVAKAPPAVPS